MPPLPPRAARAGPRSERARDGSWLPADPAEGVEEDRLRGRGARVEVETAADDVERLLRLVVAVELELGQAQPRLRVRRLVEYRALVEHLGLAQVLLRDRHASLCPQGAHRRRVDRVRLLGLLLRGCEL